MDRPDPGASASGQGPHPIVVGRALAVIVVAVVLGVLIVHSWSTGPSSTVTSPPTSAPVTSTKPTTPKAPTTTTTIATPRSQVTVLVANDSTTNGVAAAYSTVLQRAGWNVLTPVTATPPPAAKSSVYYATNKEADADAVAAALGLPTSSVLPVSSATPVSNVTGADVVVVIGSDLAAKTPATVPSSTSTTAAKTTSTTH